MTTKMQSPVIVFSTSEETLKRRNTMDNGEVFDYLAESHDDVETPWENEDEVFAIARAVGLL